MVKLTYSMAVRKRAKIRNRYNQATHLTKDTNGKVTTSQLDITNESQHTNTFINLFIYVVKVARSYAWQWLLKHEVQWNYVNSNIYYIYQLSTALPVYICCIR